MVKHRIRYALFLSCLFVLAAAADDRGLGAPVAAGDANTGIEKRVALVIGNAKYENAPLANPVNDATDMAAILKKCGFAVTLKTDCDLRDMRAALDAFGKSISKGGVALFFYAGHGMQVEGENYLVPIGANPQGPSEVEFDCLPVGRIAAKLEDGQAQLSILILDACRNNPLARSWSRSAPTGLATMQTPPGSILIYATSPGAVAQDGEGRNGVFTGSLLKTMTQPGVKVIDAFQQAAEEVRTQTSGKQVPYLGLTFTGNFTFIQANTVNVTTPEADKPVMTTAPVAPVMIGHLQVAVNAPSATVRVDGKNVGTATLEKALEVKNLPAGPVTVEVLADGYDPVSQEIEIEGEGKWAQLPVRLSKVMTTKTAQPELLPAAPDLDPSVSNKEPDIRPYSDPNELLKRRHREPFVFPETP